MITGAARAEAALLVIDAKEGVQENSRRHGYMLSMLGIRQLAVLVNKMDLVGYSRRCSSASSRSTAGSSTPRRHAAPASSRSSARRRATSRGAAARSPWYERPTVLETLDHSRPRPPTEAAVPDAGAGRLQVHRSRATTPDRGRHGRERQACRVGDEVVFYPSGKKSRVQTIEAFNRPPRAEALAGEATGFTLTSRSTSAAARSRHADRRAAPHVTTRLRVNLFWLGQSPLVPRKDYLLKLGTARVPSRVEADPSGDRRLAAGHREGRAPRSSGTRWPSARSRCKPLAFDLRRSGPPPAGSSSSTTTRSAAAASCAKRCPTSRRGSATRCCSATTSGSRATVRRSGGPSATASGRRCCSSPGRGRRPQGLARELEGRLFDEGRFVYFLGIGNVLYGVDADIDRDRENRREHLRRLAEVANLMLDAGVILIVTPPSSPRKTSTSCGRRSAPTG